MEASLEPDGGESDMMCQVFSVDRMMLRTMQYARVKADGWSMDRERQLSAGKL
jgi:hypothetical protein